MILAAKDQIYSMTSHTQTPQTIKRSSKIPEHIRSIIQQFANESKSVLQDHLIAEYLFGSYAMETYTSESDIDILILVDQFTPEMRRQMSKLASEYSLNYNVYISPIIKDRQVWAQNQRYNTLFYQDVMHYGIAL